MTRSRAFILGAVLLVGFLYWKPTQTYQRTKRQLDERRTQVRALREQKRTLERRIAQASGGEQLVREARRLGLVAPGERLFIVKGIAAWRRQHH
jgi:cell division protein FtsB